MQINPPTLKDRIFAFIGLGIFLALIIVGLVIFSYILIIGAIIGLVLFLIAFVYSKFSSKRKVQRIHVERNGRIIEHDENDK